MKKVSELANLLLWACIEDYAGLWELIWESASICPEIPENKRKNLVLPLIQLFLEKGLIILYECEEPYGELERLDRGRADQVLLKDKNWNAPSIKDISIRLGATTKGVSLYESNGMVDLLQNNKSMQKSMGSPISRRKSNRRGAPK